MVVPPGSTLERVARAAGLAVAREGFPERGYLADGTLVASNVLRARVHNRAKLAYRSVAAWYLWRSTEIVTP